MFDLRSDWRDSEFWPSVRQMGQYQGEPLVLSTTRATLWSLARVPWDIGPSLFGVGGLVPRTPSEVEIRPCASLFRKGDGDFLHVHWANVEHAFKTVEASQLHPAAGYWPRPRIEYWWFTGEGVSKLGWLLGHGDGFKRLPSMFRAAGLTPIAW